MSFVAEPGKIFSVQAPLDSFACFRSELYIAL